MGDLALQSTISEPPIPLPESHCPGDLSVEGCWPDTQVELLLWDLSRHSLLTDNSPSKEQQTDPVPCGLTPGDIRAQGPVQTLRLCWGPAHPLQKTPFCLTLHLPKDSITCVVLQALVSVLDSRLGISRGWSPHAIRSLIWTNTERGLTAHLLRPVSSTSSVVWSHRFGFSITYSFFFSIMCIYILYVQLCMFVLQLKFFILKCIYPSSCL